jgi:hypothetical protein
MKPWWADDGGLEAKMKRWRACMPVVTGLHRFAEDPDPQQSEGRIRICINTKCPIRIRNKVKGQIRIHFKLKSQIRICIKMLFRIRIRISSFLNGNAKIFSTKAT